MRYRRGFTKLGKMAESRSARSRSAPVDGPKTTRTFVWLRELPRSIPRGNCWDQLNRDGRVKIIQFGKKATKETMRALVKENFSQLAEADFKRIRLYKSQSRGSDFKRISKNVPNAAKLIHKSRDSSSQRIYLVLASEERDSQDTGSLPRDGDTAASASPAATGLLREVLDSPEANQVPQNNRETRQFLTALAETSYGDDSENELLQDPFASALLEDEDNVSLGPSSQDTNLLPLQNDVDVVILDQSSPASTQRNQPNPHPPRTETTMQPASRQRKPPNPSPPRTETATQPGFTAPSFFGEGLRVGTVQTDLSLFGLEATSNTQSRTEEVIRCLVSLTNKNTMQPPFVNHTFEEICWQAYHFERPIVAMVLSPLNQGTSRQKMLRILETMCMESTEVSFFFWVAESASIDGQEVLRLYGNGQDDQLIFLVPSTERKALFVERLEGNNLQNFSGDSLVEKVKLMMQSLTLQREETDIWRKEREKQKKEFEEMKNIEENRRKEEERRNEEERMKEEERRKEEEQNEREKKEQEEIARKIRDARRSRVGEEPSDGLQINVRTPAGRLSRRFKQGAAYQEVYDWIGGNEELPLFFTIHIEGRVVLLQDKVNKEETHDLTGREKEEAASMLNAEITFYGNVPQTEENLANTVVDGDEQNEEDKSKELPAATGTSGLTSEQRDEGQEDTDKKGNHENKRKRKGKKDRRTTAKRRKITEIENE